MNSLEENEETDWMCGVGRYRFVAKWRLIRLEGLLKNQVTALQFLKLAFLKALTTTKDFTDSRV